MGKALLAAAIKKILFCGFPKALVNVFILFWFGNKTKAVDPDTVTVQLSKTAAYVSYDILNTKKMPDQEEKKNAGSDSVTKKRVRKTFFSS